MLSGNKQQLESLAGASKTFNDAIKKARDSADVLTEANLAQEKTETIKRIAVSNAGKAAVNFGIGLGGVAKAMLSGAVEFVKGLQGTQEGTELTGQAALKAAEATGKVAETMGSLAQAIGLVMAIIPAGRIIKGIGWGLTALGIGLEQLGPALTETATEGVKILNTELEKTKTAFRIITSTGAEFAGGMT
jgi:ATP-dependent exoDNAse (exonuclease V) alpha subunit